MNKPSSSPGELHQGKDKVWAGKGLYIKEDTC